MSDTTISAIERKRIEMEYAVPLVRHLQKELGTDAVNMALSGWTWEKTAAVEAAESPEVDFQELADSIEPYAADDALDYEVTELTDETFNFNVHRCQYAQMMEDMSARDLGPSLICNHDFSMALVAGARLSRTQTCMKGFDHCNFRYTRK